MFIIQLFRTERRPGVPHRGADGGGRGGVGPVVPADGGGGVHGDGQVHAAAPLLQVHREQGGGKMRAEGKGHEEDQAGNRRLFKQY